LHQNGREPLKAADGGVTAPGALSPQRMSPDITVGLSRKYSESPPLTVPFRAQVGNSSLT